MLIVCDGLGDLPNPGFGGKTPLQAARKPNMDRLAAEGITGMVNPIGRGIIPGSDTAHLALFGYDPAAYYKGRGTFEALGAGLELREGDVAFRCNFATVRDEGGKLVVTDRRAGRIKDEGKELGKALDGLEFSGVKVVFKPTVEHRAAMVLRGKGLSCMVSDADPHDAVNVPVNECKPLDGSEEAKFTAGIVNRFVAESHAILDGHPLNEARRKQGKPPANIALPRGAGIYVKPPIVGERFGIKAACVAGGALYKGVAKFVGMDAIDVPGATGRTDTDVMAKGRAALELLQKGCDYVFIHVKGTDNAGHDGDFQGKTAMIEKIDGMLGLLLQNAGEDTFIAITGDHTTSCLKKRHSSEPVPFALRGAGIRVDDVRAFDELSCAKGALGNFRGLSVMPTLLDLLGKEHVYGS
jgi:2,3-bisphosphoglycerate-independent phosphoglycerate mutase